MRLIDEVCVSQPFRVRRASTENFKKSSLILKNNPNFNLKYYFFGKHLMNVGGAFVQPAFVVPGAVVGNN